MITAALKIELTCEAIVANLIFGALLAWRSLQARDDPAAMTLIPLA
jgi:hypothetical protein